MIIFYELIDFGSLNCKCVACKHKEQRKIKSKGIQAQQYESSINFYLFKLVCLNMNSVKCLIVSQLFSLFLILIFAGNSEQLVESDR